MGCTSSTEVVTNPHTGQEKEKHKLGGSYPGNRRKPQQPYAPPASQFNSNGQATAHFVSYGGGNALVLAPQPGGIAQPVMGQKQPQYIQVTLPAGVEPGQTIHVQAPDGRVNAIIIPDGFGPGSTFTVEFAEEEKPTTTTSYNTTSTDASSYPTTSAIPATTNDNLYNNNDYNNTYNNTNHATQDDGFATGFNNPGFVPTTTTTTSGYDYNSYPTATDAKPVYGAGPTYPASSY